MINQQYKVVGTQLTNLVPTVIGTTSLFHEALIIINDGEIINK